MATKVATFESDRELMKEKFANILIVGGKSNSLGRAEEAVSIVLDNKSRLEELYMCLFEDDAWVRMRAVDALEKVCRVHPEWLEPYIDRIFEELGDNTQPSIQWHLAQIFGEVQLTAAQEKKAIAWMVDRLRTVEVDWIVASNTMGTLAQFVQDGRFLKKQLTPLLVVQQEHHSKSVVKRATKILESLT